MKKATLFTLAAALVLTLAACGTNASEPTNTPEPPANSSIASEEPPISGEPMPSREVASSEPSSTPEVDEPEDISSSVIDEKPVESKPVAETPKQETTQQGNNTSKPSTTTPPASSNNENNNSTTPTPPPAPGDTTESDGLSDIEQEILDELMNAGKDYEGTGPEIPEEGWGGFEPVGGDNESNSGSTQEDWDAMINDAMNAGTGEGD